MKGIVVTAKNTISEIKNKNIVPESIKPMMAQVRPALEFL
jgi:hypothetical protein